MTGNSAKQYSISLKLTQGSLARHLAGSQNQMMKPNSCFGKADPLEELPWFLCLDGHLGFTHEVKGLVQMKAEYALESWKILASTKLDSRSSLNCSIQSFINFHSYFHYWDYWC